MKLNKDFFNYINSLYPEAVNTYKRFNEEDVNIGDYLICLDKNSAKYACLAKLKKVIFNTDISTDSIVAFDYIIEWDNEITEPITSINAWAESDINNIDKNLIYKFTKTFKKVLDGDGKGELSMPELRAV